MIDAGVHITQLIQQIADKLCKKYCTEQLCTQYAWWVLEAITKQKKSTLLLKRTISLSQEQSDTLEYWIKKQVLN